MWEENLRHLRDRHPDLDPEELEDVLLHIKRWTHVGSDRFGVEIWAVRWGRRAVLFNHVKGWVRIFSVQEWW